MGTGDGEAGRGDGTASTEEDADADDMAGTDTAMVSASVFKSLSDASCGQQQSPWRQWCADSNVYTEEEAAGPELSRYCSADG